MRNENHAKMMAYGLFALFVGFALLTVGLASTAAAEQNESIEQQATERIDADTELLDYGIDEESGTAWVEIESSTMQTVTVSDAGSFIDGGEVAQQSTTVPPGEATRISVPATDADGFIGVSIATSETLYAVPIDQPGSGVSLPASSAAAALVMGVVASLSSVVGIAKWQSKREEDGVSRIDG